MRDRLRAVAAEAWAGLGGVRAHARPVDYLLFVTALLLGGGARLASDATRDTRLHLLNGLPLPVEVAVDGRSSVTLAPGQRLAVEAGPGAHRLSARTSVGPIEHRMLVLDADSRVAVYSVAGAAPIYRAVSVYSPPSSPSPQPPPPQFLGGQAVLQWATIDYPFQTPPKHLSVDSKQRDPEYRSVLGLAEGGVDTTLRQLALEGQPEAAARLARALALAAPEAGRAWTAATLAARAWGRGASVPLLRAWARSAADPDLADRALQWELLQAGDRDGLADELEALTGDPPRAALWRAGLAEADEARRQLQALRAERPDDRRVKNMAARLALAQGRFGDCAADLGELTGMLESSRPGDDLPPPGVVACLVGLGRVRAARQLVDRLLDQAIQQGGDRFALAVTGLQLAGLERDQPAYLERLAGRMNTPELPPEQRDGLLLAIEVAAGRTVAASTLERFTSSAAPSRLALQSLVGQDPAAALAAVATAPVASLGGWRDELALLLAAEAIRTGARATATRLLDGSGTLAPAVVADYVLSGVAPPLAWRLGQAENAALLFVRARQLFTLGQGAAAAALVKDALRRDRLRSVVTTAIRSWPSPRAADPPMVHLSPLP